MKQKWSNEKIIQTIQGLHKRNIDLSAGYVLKNHGNLFTAACSYRYFSSWENAVTAAGIDYGKILDTGRSRRREKLTKWSKERVLEELRGFEPKDLLTAYWDRLTLYSAARREFGSWKLALEAAGYRLEKGTYKNSNQVFRLEGTGTRAKKALNIRK